MSSGNFSALLFPINGWVLGNGRYAAEFWVGSHPDLRPCDLSQDSRVRGWVRPEAPSPLSLASGARHPLKTAKRHGLHSGFIPLLLENETARNREYFLLQGHVVKWKALYDKLPPDDSWAWSTTLTESTGKQESSRMSGRRSTRVLREATPRRQSLRLERQTILCPTHSG